MRKDLPTGTVTFLFTDIEGSTRLLHHLGPDAYAEALAEHRRILREAFSTHGGVEVDTQGTRSSSPFRQPREPRAPPSPPTRRLPPAASRSAWASTPALRR
jgi:class 3 adenylate cyclase